MKHLLALACATLSCAAVVVHAKTDEPEEALAPQSHWLSASPDAPQLAFYWSGHLRARLSARIPFIGGLQEPGFSMALLPLVELQNQDGSDQALPNENWRGRLSVQGAWTWGDEPDLPRFSLGGAVEHESDHATARTDAPDVSLQLNDVALLGAVQIPKPRLMIRLDMQAITYVFGSVHGAGIVPNGDMVRELRTSLNFGVWARSRLGMWQFYALGFFGHEVGIDRANTVRQDGVGARWLP